MSLKECQIRSEEEWIAGWRTGPTYLRWTELPVQVGDAAPQVDVLDMDRQSVALSSAWTNGSALVMFWRHYGCGCGLDRVRRLHDEISEYRRLGANVVIVGQGHPEQAADYASRYDVPAPIFSDPTRAAYRAFGVVEGQPSQIFFDATPELLHRDPAAGESFASERKAQGRAPVNSPWQLPAEFVIGRDGRIRLAYRYQSCEDFPDPRILVASLDT